MPGLPVWGGVLTLPEFAREAAGAVGGPNGSERGRMTPGRRVPAGRSAVGPHR